MRLRKPNSTVSEPIDIRRSQRKIGVRPKPIRPMLVGEKKEDVWSVATHSTRVFKTELSTIRGRILSPTPTPDRPMHREIDPNGTSSSRNATSSGSAYRWRRSYHPEWKHE